MLVQRTYAQYKGESRPKPCMISCLEETRKYPNSRMDVFPDQKKSLNKLSKKKKNFEEKKSELLMINKFCDFLYIIPVLSPL